MKQKEQTDIDALADMDKAVRCLALELPEPVWKDVNKRWQAVKAGYQSKQVAEPKNFLAVLEENYQAQIAGFYNYDKTQAERDKRNAVIEEYKDLIGIWKSNYQPPKQVAPLNAGKGKEV